MRNRIKITGLVILLVMAAGGYVWYQYTRKPADVRSLSPDIEIRAVDLVKDFRNNEAAATSDYVEKILLVKGKVASIQLDSERQVTMFLNGNDPLCSVTCSFYEGEIIDLRNILPGAEINIKGQCTGMLSDVILNKCSIVK